MAKEPTSFTSPSTGILTEVYYATSETAAPIQIFGVQSVPQFLTAKDDVTYTALESDTEYATKGRRAYETMEMQTLYYPEQQAALETIAATDADVYYYVKLPTVGTATGKIYSWKGSLDVSIDEIDDDMIYSVIKMGKSTVPAIVSSLPTGA